jgi:cytosol aminopeptidase
MEITTSSDIISVVQADGLVIGVFSDNTIIPDNISNDSLLQLLKNTNFEGKSGKKRIYYNVEGFNVKCIAVVGLNAKDDFNHEATRAAIATGVKYLREEGCKSVALPSFGYTQAAAEGALLGLYRFDELMTMNTETRPILDKLIYCGDETDEWQNGVIVATAQNLARRLGELPSNIATPTFFTEEAKKALDGEENIKISIYDADWAKNEKMGAFLAVAKGSNEPAKFLVIEYTGGSPDEQPLAYVGKGITFDTGGISLKPAEMMGAMRGDCSGAAATIATLVAIAKLKLAINVVGVTPLTENMPSGHATKPSDVVFASNGKSIEIDNTDAEGRLVLSDALVYTEKTFKPHTIIDIATLTGAMMIALGEYYIGAFARSDELWNELKSAGEESGEEFWRMPLDKKYTKQLKSTLADLKNVGGRTGGSITAAMFLSEFVDLERWAHIDIAGTAWPSVEGPYKPKGNAGVPVRALIKFAEKFVK